VALADGLGCETGGGSVSRRVHMCIYRPTGPLWWW
jgi:hypothetical protein